MKNVASPVSIHLWFPNIFEFKGGIQVYSAFFLEALQSIEPRNFYDVFIKHDTCCSPEFPQSPNIDFHCTGKWRLSLRTFIFAATIFGYGLWQKPTLIITTHLNFSIVAYWLKRLLGIPYWIVVHGVEAWDVQRPYLKEALSHADCILAVSGYTRDRLLKEQHLDPHQIVVLPNTFDASRFRIAPKSSRLLKRYSLNLTQPIILTVARLDSSERYKGYDKILAALPRIREVHQNVHYLLVGTGNDSSRIEQLVSQLNLQDCVTLAGFVPDEELADYYNLCDVFAMPSKGEGFGIVYLEALACGKPVLGGNQDGAIDALCYGELGALVNPDDVSEIAKTLIEILKGTYSNTLIYQPEMLRKKVIEIYGFEKFKKTLSSLTIEQDSLCESSFPSHSSIR
ncbi:glycosyltransferase [Lusitaniella coriacea LEGE 07157]|uniref:Glycosyltransferase n=1 Tax=Lusitaniella coriacea LEGE 07157 TaxID=945747 RepID=A0A8J7IUE2_9CYAN|nr:glycosyltransferase [Lusitaniella coriacea]MBE9117497.1 glycosyltransferase [Lusitaniella coriacea LEGE 07157]